MYKKFFMGIAAMAALTLVSCSSDDLNSLSDNSSKNEAISFDGYLGRSAVSVNGTRGSVVDKTALIGKDKGFGVFGYYNSSATDHSSAPEQSFNANLFNNEHVTCSQEDADWEYSPLKYWPAQGHVDFLAYAPYVANKALTGSKFNFIVSETITNQTDLLWAKAENMTKNNLTENKVKFQFAHALSRLGYTVKLNKTVSASEATITLNKITLAGSAPKNPLDRAFYTKGTIDLSKTPSDEGLWASPDPKDPKQNFEWFSDENKKPAEKTLSGDVNKEIKNLDNEYLFVIPQNFKTGSDNLYVIVDYTIKYNSGSAQPTVTYKVFQQLQYDFEQGKAYTINLTIGLTPIDFDADVTPWVDETNKNTDINIDSWN